MANNIWQLQDAKAKFSEVVERALAHGVQIVTRRGKNAVVVLPFSEYKRLIGHSDTLTGFLLESPLAGSGLRVERERSLPRDIEIEP